LIEFISSIEFTSPLGITILIISGILVGAINTFAGSGSIISYSLFMLFGLPPSVANGTLRVGVVLQTLATSVIFNKGKILEIRKGLILGIPTTIGSIVGAQIAVTINKELFQILVGFAVILMIITMFIKPSSWVNGQKEKIKPKPTYLQILIFFLIGIYGGFIHIGVGIFLLAGLVLNAGYDLVKANALKVFIVLLYSPFALAVYVYNNEVAYLMGSIAGFGNLIGGIVASKYALKKGSGALRIILLVILFVFAAKMFGVFEYLYGLAHITH